MNIIKPEKLKIGDTIGILATAGAVEEKENVLRAKTFFEERGYKVVISDNAFSEYRYLAGTDEEKIKHLHNFFENKDIKAIICMRGGYGAIRLIKKINYEIIKNNPKIFCGYSDISALSIMMLKNANLMTYSGPLAQSDFGVKEYNRNTINSFFDTINNDYFEYKAEGIYKEGWAEGMLWGGNLATVTSLCGQDFIPDENFIFFTEELNEPAYKIDKMMTQLINIDKFKNNIKGIILGDFLNIDNTKWLDEIFIEIAENLNVPIYKGFKITHSPEKITIPIGAKAEMTSNKLKITK